MVEQGPRAVMNPEASDGDTSEGFDLENARNMVGFVLRATRRRPKLAVVTFVLIAALGVAVAVTMPRTYSAEVKLLAQRSSMHALTGQNAQIEDDPTKNVAAMILRRDNVVALAKESNLPKRFEETRPAPLRLKDQIVAKLFGGPSDTEKLSMMVYTLQNRLNVTVGDDSTVTISVDWSNPQVAYDLVTLVQKNFLEARYDSDVAVINDSIAVLEDHAKSELAQVDTELDAYQKIVSERAPKPVAPPAVVVPAAAPELVIQKPRAATDAGDLEASADAAKELEEKRLQIRSMEDARQHRIDTLNQQLAEAQLTLTPMHPTVIALQQQLAAMNEIPPDLQQLRSDERSLMAQIAPPKVNTPAPTMRFAPPPRRLSLSPAADAEAPASEQSTSSLPVVPMDRDGPLQLAQSKLELAIRAYEEALVRLDATRVELDITGAAYKHRYTVVTPAERPRRPKKATAQIVGAGSVLGGALLALLFAAGLDVLGGVILEAWQVRRRLKLDILGELDNPS